GGRIFENTRAKGGLVTGPSGGVVKAMNGSLVKASEAVILATNSPINRNQLWVHDRQIPMRDYMVALEVPKGNVHFAQLTSLYGIPVRGGFLSDILSRSPGPHYRVRVAQLPTHHLVAGEGGGGAASSYESNKELLLVRGAMHQHGQEQTQLSDGRCRLSPVWVWVVRPSGNWIGGDVSRGFCWGRGRI
ncbi:hypothetical protein Vretifemale_2477, partial [Volvox reticuliferus]